MIRNYLKIAIRSLWTEKLFSVINLVGLSVGLAAFLLIMIFVRNELGYESFFAGADRIYSIAMDIHPDDGSPDIAMATNAPQVAPLLKAEFSQVEEAARLFSWNASVQEGDGAQSYANTALVDNDLFRIFDFVWLQGDPAQALVAPDSIVLTASAARRYFGDSNPVGKSLILESNFTMRVTGVIEDLPENTHLSFDMLGPISLVPSVTYRNALDNWSNQTYHTYVLLAAGSDPADLQSRFPDFIDRHIGEGASRFYAYSALPIKDIHLHSNRRSELSPPGNATTVNAFIVIALLVLLVACMNFMNLSTVKGARRAREIGVRKVIGAHKSQVILQFLGEALMLTLVAVLIALALVELALPAFGALLQRQLHFSLFDSVLTVPLLVLLILGVSLVSSGYSSLYLSSFKPARVLKGDIVHGKGASVFRNALVVLQFAVAVALLIATATMSIQLDYLRAFDPGYDRDQVVVLNNTGREGLGRQWDLLKRELQRYAGISAVTAANTMPTEQVGPSYYIEYQGGSERRSTPMMLVGYDYFATFGIELISGRVFSGHFSQDRRAPFSPDTSQTSGTYILNELAASQLGWTPEQAIGKWVQVSCCNMGRGVVVGVVKNVNYGSLRFGASPVLYAIPPEPAATLTNETRLGLRQAAIRINSGDIRNTLAQIDAAWKKFRPDQPISRAFLDESFARLYQEEERQGKMMTAFSLLAVFITCMGLFGLATYNAQRRTKEIGVRKVMGSSVWSIVLLLTNDFSKLVLVSNIIAWPVAYFAMNRWLENFAYRIDLAPMIFIGSGLIALCIAWVTVGGTAARAASQKPVLALRYE